MSTMMPRRRHLRAENIAPTPSPSADSLEYTKSELVIVGYNETTGEPIYIEPCISNDNPDPYGILKKCTEVPTAMPTLAPSSIPSVDELDGEDEGRDRYDSAAASNAAANGSGGKLVYGCASSSELCNLYGPGEDVPPPSTADPNAVGGNNYSAITGPSESSGSDSGSGSGSSSGSSSSSPWTLLGPCRDSESTTCPDTHDAERADAKDYETGDQISLKVDRYVFTCVNDDTCNENEPSLEGVTFHGDTTATVSSGSDNASSNGGSSSVVAEQAVSNNSADTTSGNNASSEPEASAESDGTDGGSTENESGWKLTGGCQLASQEGCADDEYDEEVIYDVGDEASILAVFSENSSVTDGNVTDGNVTTPTTSYAYECTSDRYCNQYPPGNSQGVGWTLIGTCQVEIDCPLEFDESKAEGEEYVEGDMAMISSDYLNDKVIGSILCPGAASSSQQQGNVTRVDDGTVLVPYAYEVETSQVSTADTFLPRLEEQILLNLADSMMSCLGAFSGGKRKLRKEEMLRMSAAVVNARQLDGDDIAEYYVRGIESRPEDMAVTEGPCTISSLGADNCFIINGGLTLLLTPLDDTTYNSAESAMVATDAAQSNLQDAMANDDLLSPNMPEVIKVTYLADSYEDYLAGYVAGESGLAKGGAVVGDGNGAVDGDREDNDGGGGVLWGMLGGMLGAVMIIMCALLLIKRRRVKERSRYDEAAAGAARNARDYDSQVVGPDFDWEDWDESFDVNDPDGEEGAAAIGGGANGEVVLHVGNLGPNTSVEQVRELFEQHGTVNNCIIPADHRRENGLDPPTLGQYADERFALLTMLATNEAEIAEAESACNHVNGLEIEDGYALSVKEVTTLYVANLSPNTTEEDVHGLFEKYGTVTGCIIPADHEQQGDSARGRFALVTMHVEDAQNAVSHVDGMEVHGNELSVRDIKHMNGGRGIPGGGLAAAALGAGAVGAVAAFNAQRNPEVTLHVGNLSPNMGEDDVRELFEEHGTVTQCIIPFDEEGVGDNSRGRFALVTMPAEEAFNACNYMNGLEVDGHRLSVREAPQRGSSGMKNLMDDTSSTFDNSYGYSDANYAHRHGLATGEKEEHLGVLVSLAAMGSFVGGMFLLKPCKKKTQNDSRLDHLASITGRSYAHDSPGDAEQSLDDGLDNIINNIDSVVDANDRRNFVVDPPGAFHLGNHHYTGDGVRYFSPLCEQCIAARADADGVVALDAISEEDDASVIEEGMSLTDANDLSFDLEAATKFTDFASNDLGRFHSSMHVRHCKSTTCDLCRKEKGVHFVKARKELASDSSRREGLL